jgi:hypothetical protein
MPKIIRREEERLLRLAVLLKISEMLKEKRRRPKSKTERAAERALQRFAAEVLRHSEGKRGRPGLARLRA